MMLLLLCVVVELATLICWGRCVIVPCQRSKSIMWNSAGVLATERLKKLNILFHCDHELFLLEQLFILRSMLLPSFFATLQSFLWLAFIRCALGSLKMILASMFMVCHRLTILGIKITSVQAWFSHSSMLLLTCKRLAIILCRRVNQSIVCVFSLLFFTTWLLLNVLLSNLNYLRHFKCCCHGGFILKTIMVLCSLRWWGSCLVVTFTTNIHVVMMLFHHDACKDHFSREAVSFFQGLSSCSICFCSEFLQLLFGRLNWMNCFLCAHDAIFKSSFRFMLGIHGSLIIRLISEILHERRA